MDFSKDSKIWIFQSSRKFTFEEKKDISANLSSFILGWKSHGEELLANFDLHYDQFIVISVDENKTKASGCSIDKLMNLIKEIDRIYCFDLLDRSLVAYEENQSIQVEKLSIFKQKVREGTIKNIKVFNNGISTLNEFGTTWLLPLEKSWAKTLLN